MEFVVLFLIKYHTKHDNTHRRDNEQEERGDKKKDLLTHLGQEHEDESLAEVAVDADHGECHAGEVAVRVSHESACREPGREGRRTPQAETCKE